MTIVIRPFADADREAAVALWNGCGLVVPWNDPTRDIARKIAQRRETFLVAEHDGRIVGTVMAGFDGHRGSLNYLAVDPNRRKQGIARRLMSEAERLLTAAGCPKINVMVRRSNLAAAGFYDALGYQPDDVVVYGKRLIID
jgi:ribosomal protein S18 acetylase RimI-like enzyme